MFLSFIKSLTLMHAIEVKSVSKVFRKRKNERGIMGKIRSLLFPKYELVKAVDNVSFRVKKREVLGLLGPNGAGKTTLIRMICGILYPTEGEIKVLGMNPQKERKKVVQRLGAVFGHKSQLPLNLKAKDSIEIVAMMYNVEKSVFEKRFWKYAEILEVERLTERRIRELSLGERMRFEIMASLIHEPEILLLDEPTLGLDFVAKAKIRELVHSLKKTIIFTSHDAMDIEAVCKRVIILSKGRVIIDTSIQKLKKLIPYKYAEIVTERKMPFLPEGWEREGETLIKKRVSSFEEVEKVLPKLKRYGIADVVITYPSVEEVLVRVFKECNTCD